MPLRSKQTSNAPLSLTHLPFTLYSRANAQVAQSVEQGTENPRVGGSIPPLGMFKI